MHIFSNIFRIRKALSKPWMQSIISNTSISWQVIGFASDVTLVWGSERAKGWLWEVEREGGRKEGMGERETDWQSLCWALTLRDWCYLIECNEDYVCKTQNFIRDCGKRWLSLWTNNLKVIASNIMSRDLSIGLPKISVAKAMRPPMLDMRLKCEITFY